MGARRIGEETLFNIYEKDREGHEKLTDSLLVKKIFYFKNGEIICIPFRRKETYYGCQMYKITPSDSTLAHPSLIPKKPFSWVVEQHPEKFIRRVYNLYPVEN